VHGRGLWRPGLDQRGEQPLLDRAVAMAFVKFHELGRQVACTGERLRYDFVAHNPLSVGFGGKAVMMRPSCDVTK
jgi:hypothetical protein